MSTLTVTPRLTSSYTPGRLAFGNNDRPPVVSVPAAPKFIGSGKLMFAAVLTTALTAGGAAWQKWTEWNAMKQTIAQQQADARAKEELHQLELEMLARMVQECSKKPAFVDCTAAKNVAREHDNLKMFADRL